MIEFINIPQIRKREWIIFKIQAILDWTNKFYLQFKMVWVQKANNFTLIFPFFFKNWPKSVSDIIHNQIISLYQTKQFSPRQIASHLKVSQNCVQQSIRKFIQFVNSGERKRGRVGRKPTWSQRQSRSLMKMATANSESIRRTLSELTSIFNSFL